MARRKPAVVGVSLLFGAAMSGMALMLGLLGADAATHIYPLVVEPFTNSTLNNPLDWTQPALPTAGTNHACLTASTTTTKTTTNPIPGCATTGETTSGTGTLRFTTATTDQDGGVAYTASVPSTHGLDITFDSYQFGGNGADGISFFMTGTNPADPAGPTAMGPFGGHLGYSGGTAAPAGDGMVNGYLGIGLDTFGNFTSKTYGGSTCSTPSWAGGKDANQLTVRGPGTTEKGYCLIASTEAIGGLKGKLTGGASGTHANSLVPVEIAINPSDSTVTTPSGLTVRADSYKVAVTPLRAAQQIISGTLPVDTFLQSTHPTWLTSTTGIPSQLSFGFAGSTGATTNIHELRDVQILPLTSNPARLALTLTTSGAGVLVKNSPVTYTDIPSLSSSGGTEAVAPTLITTFPTGVTPGTATGTDWSCTTVGQVVTCHWTGTLPITSATVIPPVQMPATVGTTTGTKTVVSVFTATGGVEAVARDTSQAVLTAKKTKAALGLSVTDSAAGDLVEGSSVTYTARGSVSVNGTSETDAPKFVDTFPTGLTPTTPKGTHWTCTVAGQKVTCTWTGGTIAAGTALTPITIKVAVGSSASGGLADTGVLSSANATPLTVKSTDYATVISVPVYKLTITDNKAGDFTTPQTVTYSVTASLSATGSNEVKVPVVTDSFPAEFTSITATGTHWTCVQSGTAATGFTEVCTWTGGNITAGAKLTKITFKAKVKSGLATGTSVDDAVSITSNDAATVTANDNAEIKHAPPPELEVTADAPSAASVGSTYALTVNATILSTGEKATHDPVVVVTVPTDEKFTVTPTPATWTCARATTTKKLTCTSTHALPIAAGAVLPTISASVKATDAGEYSAGIHFSDPTDGATAATASATTDVTVVPVLTLAISGTPTHMADGGSYTLTMTSSVKSTGGPTHHHPVLTATLPTGEVFTGTPTATGWSCALATGTKKLTCTSTLLLPNTPGTALGPVVAKVKATATSTTAKTTTVTLTDTADLATTVTKTASITTITATPGLTLTTAGTPASANVGTDYVLTLTSKLTSAGVAYHDPVLTVTLPTGEKFAADPAPTGWTCSLSTTTKKLTCTSTHSTTPDIPASTTLDKVSATVDITGYGTLTTVATLSDPKDGATAVTKTATVKVAAPILTLTTSGTPAKATIDTTYTLTFTPAIAAGSAAEHDPVLTVTLPAGEVFTGTPAPATWTCVKTSTTKLTCTSKKATPVAGGTALGAVTAVVKVTATGTKTMTATLADTSDNAAEVSVTAKVDVTAIPVLTLAISGVPAHMAVGGIYTLTVTSSLKATGGVASHHPAVTVTLPAGEEFTGTPSAATWSCVKTSTTKATCTSTKTLPITSGSVLGPIVVKVKATTKETAARTTSVTLSDPTDGATAVTKTEKTTTITTTPVLTLAISGVPAHMAVGGTYTLSVTSKLTAAGPAYHDPSFTVTLPAGEVLTGTPSGTGWTCTATTTTKATCTSTHTLTIPASSTLGTVVVKVKATTKETAARTTSVTLSDAKDGATAVTKTEKTTTITTTPVLTLAISGVPAHMAVGGTYTLSVTSKLTAAGPAYHDPSFTVTLPAGEVLTGTPSGTGWTCTATTTTKATCTSTHTLTIPASSTLGTVVVKVKATTKETAARTTSVTLSDAKDGATAVTKTEKTTTITTTPVLTLAISGVPAHMAVGGTYTLSVTSKLTAAGPAYHDPSFTVTLPAGEVLTGTPSGTGWTCTATTTTKATCTSTHTLTIPASSTLGTVVVKVKATTKETAARTTSVTLSDAKDGATAVTKTEKTTTITTTPVLTLAVSGVPAHMAVGGTYTLSVTSKLTAAGPAYHDPSFTVTLPAGEVLTGTPSGTGWTCTATTTTKATCTSTHTLTIPASSTLGTVVVKVKATTNETAARTTSVTLSDPKDGATAVTKTEKTTTITTTPVLTLAISGVPAHMAVGGTYTLSVTSKLTAAGPAYHDPSFTVTLPAGEVLTGTPSGTGWTCTATTTTKATCTSTHTLTIPASSTLGTVVVKVKATTKETAARTTSVTLSDPTDGATAVTKTEKTTTITTTPVLTLAISGVPAHMAVGGTYTLSVTSKLTAAGPAYHDPSFTVTLPAGEVLTGTPSGTGWTCTATTTTKATCTSTHTLTIPASSTLGTVVVKVKATTKETAARTTSVTLSDPKDGATAVTKTEKTTTITTTPVLTLAISGVPAHMAVGGTYTLSVTSKLTAAGPAYHDPSFTVTLPAGEVLTGTPSGTGWTCTATTTTKATCTSTHTLTIPASSTLGTVVVKVKATTKETAARTTSVTLSDPTDGATAVTKTEKTTTITTTPVLTLTTSGTPSVASIGTEYTLHLTPAISVTGGVAYHDPVLTVTLPDGEHFVADPTGSGWSCVLSGTAEVATCTSTEATPIAAGALGVVTGEVDITKAGTKMMSATLADPKDGVATVSAEANVTVSGVTALSLTTSGTPTYASVNATYPLTLSPALSDTGGVANHDPVLKATLPSGEVFVKPTVTPSGWTCTIGTSGRKLVCTSTAGIPIRPGTALGTVVITVEITSTGKKTMVATLADPSDGASTVTTTATVTVTATPVLALTTSGTPSHASVGTSYTVTLTPSLTGTAYHDPKLVATLTSGEEFTGPLAAPTWSCTVSVTKQTLTCTSKKLATLGKVTATVKITSTGKKTMVATLADPSDGALTVTVSATVTATTAPTLVISTTGTPSNASAGSSYTLVVTTSTGPAGPAYHDPVVTITLPAGEHFTGTPTAAGWNCVKTSTTKLTCTSEHSTTPSIPASTTLGPIKVEVSITPSATGLLTTSVTASDPKDATTTVTTTATVTVTATPVLALTTSGTPSHASVGTSYTVTLTPSLTGTAYHDPKLVATLTSGEEFTGPLAAPTWSCTVSVTKQTLTCTSKKLATLGKVTATVKITSTGKKTMVATLADPSDGALTVTVSATVTATTAPTLVISTTGTPSNASAGSSYTLVVTTSTGPAGPAYHDPVVTITLPAGEHFTGTPTAAGWNCVKTSTTKLTCTSEHSTTPSIPASTTLGPIKVEVSITPSATGLLTTSVTASDPKDATTTVTTTATVTVTATPVLALTTSGTPSHASVGTSYTVTLTPSLTGTAYHDPKLVATLTSGEEFTGPLAAPTWSCTVSVTKQTLTCTSKKLATLGKVTATVKITSTGKKTMVATLADPSDGALTVTVSATVTATTAPTLVISTTGTPSNASAGSSYTLVVTTSTGPAGPAYHDPVVTITLPAGEHFTGTPTAAGWNCVKTSTTKLTCTSEHSTTPSIPASTTLGPIKVEVSITPSATGLLTTSVTASDPKDATTTVTTTATVTVTATPVLALTTSGTPSHASVGTSYTVTLTPSLTGTAYHDPKLVATLTSGEEFTGPLAAPTWSCTVSVTKQTLTCTSKKLATLGKVTATVKITSTGKKTMVATLADPSDGALTVTVSATVTATTAPTLVISTTGTPSNASAGSSYTLVVTTSTGPAGPAYHDPVVTITLPAGEHFTGTPTAAGWNCVKTSTTKLTCTSEHSTTPSIPASTTLGPIKVEVSITPSATGLLTTSVTASDPKDATTTVTTTATVTVTATPVLALTTSGTPSHASVGTSYTVTLTPSLTGTAYHDPKLVATLTSGEEFTGPLAAPTWSCTVSVTKQTLTCTSKKLATLGKVTATVKITSTGTKVLIATLADPSDGATTVTVSATLTATTAPTLSLTTSGSPARVSVGTSYTVTLTPSLTGTAYHDPKLVATLTSGEEFTGPLTAPTWDCTVSVTKQTLTCTSKKTPPITTGSLGTVTATVKVTSPGTKTMVATLADEPDNATTVTATATVTSTSGPALNLTATPSASHVSAGASYTLTLTPSLTGTALHDPKLVVTLQTGEKFTGTLTAPTWSCTVSVTKQTLTCTSKKLATLGKVSATIKVTAGASGTKQATATLSDDDDAATPVTKTAKVTVTAAPVLALTATPSASHVSAGTIYSLTLTPSLTGSAYHDPKLVVDLPAGEKFTGSLTAPTWVCTKTSTTKATCTSKRLSTLGKVTVTIKVTAGASGTKQATATLSDGGDAATPVTKTAKVTVTAAPVLALTATPSASHVSAGASYTLTLTPSLTGTAYHDPALTVTLPAGEKFTGTLNAPTWSCTVSVTKQTLTCTSKRLATLGKVTATIKVTAGASGTKQATATLSDGGDAATPVTKTAKVTVTKPTPPKPPGLVVSVSGAPAAASAGTKYTLVVTVSTKATGGPADHDPTVSVTLPTGETFASAPTTASWHCTLTGRRVVLTCTSKATTPITPGSKLPTLTVPVDISSSASGSLTSTTTVSDPGDLATPVSKSTKVNVTAAPVLSLTTSGTPTKANVGTNYTLTLKPSVTGTAYHHPKLTVTLPSGETFASAPSVTGWSCRLTGSATLSCTATTTSGLKTVPVTVDIASTATAGAHETHATLSDATDAAKSVTAEATVTVTSSPSAPPELGYRLVGGDGGVFAYGDASFLGSMVSRHQVPSAPIVGIADTPTGNGYWIVGSDGSIYTFGNAQNFGSIPSIGVKLDKPIVGIAGTPTGGGYWLVASDGGVFAFGNAGFFGNTYTLGIENQLDKPVVGITDTPTGGGYWLVASDGGVFAFGNAGYYGNTYTLGIENQLDKPMVGMAATPSGQGYWLVAADGGVFAFGSAAFDGNTYTVGIENKLQGPVVGIAAMPPGTGSGYWLGATDGGVFAFGTAPFLGNTYTTGIEDDLNAPMTGIAFSP